MTPARWRQVEELFHAASQRDSNERDAFLREASEGDEDLKSEVESLLRLEASSEDLLAWGAKPGCLRMTLETEPESRKKLVAAAVKPITIHAGIINAAARTVPLTAHAHQNAGMVRSNTTPNNGSSTFPRKKSSTAS